MLEEAQELLKKNWDLKESELIIKLIENLKSYKKLIPKNLKIDIKKSLELCNDLKDELEIYKFLIKNNLIGN